MRLIPTTPDKFQDRPIPGEASYDPVAQPYGGPYPNGVDTTAGGADSSPYENEPTGVRCDMADVDWARYSGASSGV